MHPKAKDMEEVGVGVDIQGALEIEDGEKAKQKKEIHLTWKVYITELKDLHNPTHINYIFS